MKIIAAYQLPKAGDYPALFWLTESCVLKPGRIFFVPDWDARFLLFPMLALRVERVGKGFPARFAHRYASAASVWLHARGFNSLQALAGRGLPVGSALCFDSSLISAPFVQMPLEVSATSPACIVTENESVTYEPPGVEAASDIVARVAERNTLRMGDVILLPLQGPPITPCPGTRPEAGFIDREPLTRFLIK